MTKTNSTTTTTRLARRTAFQVAAAKQHLADRLVEAGETTLELSGTPAEVGTAISKALDTVTDRGERTALFALRKAVDAKALTEVQAELAAKKAPAKASADLVDDTLADGINALNAAKKAGSAKAPAKKAAKKATPAKAEGDAPTTGPRGEILARKGAKLGADLAGYEVTVAFREFEVAKHPTLAKDAGRWAVLCTLHDRSNVLTGADASASTAEKLGSRKNRATWCGGCQTQGASAKAVAEDDARNGAGPAKAPAKKAATKAPAKKATAKKAPAKKSTSGKRSGVKLEVLDGLMNDTFGK